MEEGEGRRESKWRTKRRCAEADYKEKIDQNEHKIGVTRWF